MYLCMEPQLIGLTYSFGGTPDAPLVSRRVQVDARDADSLQEALLMRTDALLADLCAVFDAAFAVLEEDSFANTTALDIAAGAAFYATRNVIDPCPTTAYGCMFTRAQQLVRVQDRVLAACGQAVHDALLTVLLPTMKTLLRIDTCFAEMPLA